jgi:hypothetical protein
METIARKRRHERASTPQSIVINERDKAIFRLLNARYRFKYLTTSAIAEFVGATDPYKLDPLKRRLRQHYDAGYLDRPYQQRRTENANYKDLVYERTDKAAREVGGVVPAHRSNSFPHELLADLGFGVPLFMAVKQRGWKGYDAEDLLRGAMFKVNTNQGIKWLGFPPDTLPSSDPFLVKFSGVEMRMDWPPFMLETNDTLYFFPGIEVDRSNESLVNVDPKDPERTTLTQHLDDIIQFHDQQMHVKHYGFTSFFAPIICINESRMVNAMNHVRTKRGATKFMLFKTLPDIAYQMHLPKPSSEWFLSPWKRVTATSVEEFSF